MNRYQKFEKHFPFYRMDVNGYVMLINEAIKIESIKDNIKIEAVSLKALSISFNLHETWNDL